MTDLTKQKCEACTIDAPLVDKKRFTELLKELDGWEIIYEDINILSKTYSFDSRQGNLVEEHIFIFSFFLKEEHPVIKIKLAIKRI